MRRIVPLVLVFAASGCEIIEDLGDPAGGGRIDVEVETSDGVLEISWDHGDAHVLQVGECESRSGDCECWRGQYLGATNLPWTVGYDRLGTYDDGEDLEPILQSPVIYGDPVVPDHVHRAAQPLEPGATYGVTVEVLAKKGQVTDKPRAAGCVEFVME